jgi:hypothetical protein
MNHHQYQRLLVIDDNHFSARPAEPIATPPD